MIEKVTQIKKYISKLMQNELSQTRLQTLIGRIRMVLCVLITELVSNTSQFNC